MERSSSHSQGDFKELQLALGRHLRSPQESPAPEGLEDRRLQIYRDLLFNNIQGFVSAGFPQLRQLYTDEGWEALVRDFYRDHQSRTPYFSEIGAEFVAYLGEERQGRPGDPPFAAELAHYEYAETALYTAPDPEIPAEVDANRDPVEHMPYLTPLALVFSYHWPVHSIDQGHCPWQRHRTHLLLFRDRLDRVRCLVITAAIAELAERIRGQDISRPVSGAALVDGLIGEQAQLAPFREQALAEIHKLRRQGAIVGAVAAPDSPAGS